MRLGPVPAVLAVILSLGASPSLAMVCQNTSMSLDEVVGLISAAPGCERAMKIFTDCSLGTSGDVQLGEAVEKKGERDFLGIETFGMNAYRRNAGEGVVPEHTESEGGAPELFYVATGHATFSVGGRLPFSIRDR